jgi:hypothetical protein
MALFDPPSDFSPFCNLSLSNSLLMHLRDALRPDGCSVLLTASVFRLLALRPVFALAPCAGEAGVDLDANAEWGGVVPWSDVNPRVPSM